MRAGLLLDPTGHPIIAHRGTSGEAPENTLAAFDLAVAQQADALELDIRVSADGVAVVIHDPTLIRTTDLEGEVAQLSLEGLRRADAGFRFTRDGGRWFPCRGRGVRIPTFREVLDRYPETPLLVELKVVEAMLPVRDAILAAGAADRCVVASFHDRALEAFRRPPFLAGASRRDIVALALTSFLGLPPRRRAALLYAVPVRYQDWIPVATSRFVAAAKRLGRPVHVWVVNGVETAERLWELGAAGMITNYPARLRAARERS